MGPGNVLETIHGRVSPNYLRWTRSVPLPEFPFQRTYARVVRRCG